MSGRPASGGVEDQMFDLATSSREHRPRIRVFGLGLLAVVMLAILGMNSVACVRTGHVGIVTVFGRVTGTTMSEGIHPVNPLARVHELDIKTQEVKERAAVPSREGLIMGLEASVLYHLDPTCRWPLPAVPPKRGARRRIEVCRRYEEDSARLFPPDFAAN